MRIPLPRPGAKSFIAMVFAVLALALACGGYLVFDYQRKSDSLDAEQRVAVIAEIRAQQVTAWMNERRANARVQGRGSLLANQIAQWLRRGAAAGSAAAAIKSQFALIAEAYGYRTITLVDAQGRPVLSTEEPPEINAVEYRAAAEVMRTGETVISDFHRSINRGKLEPEIDILAPVYGNDDAASPIAVLIFDIDPETSLHSLIESWPIPSLSAETYLVERDGNSVRYLTDLRYQKDAQFNLHLPLDRAELVEAMGLRGQQGAVAGVDYRGVNVLAFLRPIPDTAWLLVAKVDSAEISAPLRRLAAITAVIMTILVLAAALTTIAWVRARRESEGKFLGFAEAADQAFWILELFPERIVYVNPVFERIWGHATGELYRNPALWKEAIHREDRPRVTAAFENWINGIPDARYAVEYRVVRPDGQIRWIADHGFILQSRGSRIYRVAGIAEDITEHKRANEALRQVNVELEQRVRSRTTELERSRQELQELIAVQESFQDEERKRLARELHDELSQKLTVLKLQIASITPLVSAKVPDLSGQIQDINSLLTETIHAVGQIAANLRPVVLDELGLVTALRDLVEEFSERTRIDCEFSVHPEDLSVDRALATPLYRMVQESLTNVARHAEATEVIVSLYQDAAGTITLDINDNGKGFTNVDRSMHKSFGLIGMRERAAMLGGEMKIHSQPGIGTAIEIVIPRRADPPLAGAAGTHH